MRIEHKLTHEYIKRFGMGTVSARSIEQALEKQGYTVVEYSRISNQPDVETLLTSIGLKDFSRSVRAFYYHDANIRVVFVEENLSENERLVLLAHEQGHILCDPYHKSEDRSDIMCERSAAEIAHYLTVGTPSIKVRRFFVRNKKQIVAGAAALLFAAVAVAAVLGITGSKNAQTKEPDRMTTASDSYIREDEYSTENDDEYFVTIHGTKYHKEDCGYIEGKVVTVLTLEQCEKSGYEPCSGCIKN